MSAAGIAALLLSGIPGLALAEQVAADEQVLEAQLFGASAEDEDPFARPENLDWTWLAAGSTVFIGTTAILTALDVRSMERELQRRIDESRRTPMPGSTITSLAARTERRATLSNVLWGLTVAGILATGGALYLETSGRSFFDGGGGGALAVYERRGVSERSPKVGLLTGGANFLSVTWRLP